FDQHEIVRGQGCRIIEALDVDGLDKTRVRVMVEFDTEYVFPPNRFYEVKLPESLSIGHLTVVGGDLKKLDLRPLSKSEISKIHIAQPGLEIDVSPWLQTLGNAIIHPETKLVANIMLRSEVGEFSPLYGIFQICDFTNSWYDGDERTINDMIEWYQP
ncbi:MAG: hypothetical protein ACW98Y_12965, partial [Candidatus Thorarchaeota archaeon]